MFLVKLEKQNALKKVEYVWVSPQYKILICTMSFNKYFCTLF